MRNCFLIRDQCFVFRPTYTTLPLRSYLPYFRPTFVDSKQYVTSVKRFTGKVSSYKYLILSTLNKLDILLYTDNLLYYHRNT